MGLKKNIRHPSGVDKGLIKMFLKMTPEERLRANDNAIRTLTELRNDFKRSISSAHLGGDTSPTLQRQF
jgi:hypothetical protein